MKLIHLEKIYLLSNLRLSSGQNKCTVPSPNQRLHEQSNRKAAIQSSISLTTVDAPQPILHQHSPPTHAPWPEQPESKQSSVKKSQLSNNIQLHYKTLLLHNDWFILKIVGTGKFTFYAVIHLV
ncbi:hypothetical protein CEXT_486091 [Caerostris extrusa]|uniref:Uncharacterized protein n=1 Tax=Caerostris extrusa TaxID=172846 RepID=A0AAV4N2E4_CAEEX|nr:hypothetical protein CEXT_486091 [Caerostris extrusa]